MSLDSGTYTSTFYRLMDNTSDWRINWYYHLLYG